MTGKLCECGCGVPLRLRQKRFASVECRVLGLGEQACTESVKRREYLAAHPEKAEEKKARAKARRLELKAQRDAEKLARGEVVKEAPTQRAKWKPLPVHESNYSQKIAEAQKRRAEKNLAALVARAKAGNPEPADRDRLRQHYYRAERDGVYCGDLAGYAAFLGIGELPSDRRAAVTGQVEDSTLRAAARIAGAWCAAMLMHLGREIDVHFPSAGSPRLYA